MSMYALGRIRLYLDGSFALSHSPEVLPRGSCRSSFKTRGRWPRKTGQKRNKNVSEPSVWRIVAVRNILNKIHHLFPSQTGSSLWPESIFLCTWQVYQRRDVPRVHDNMVYQPLQISSWWHLGGSRFHVEGWQTIQARFTFHKNNRKGGGKKGVTPIEGIKKKNRARCLS